MQLCISLQSSSLAWSTWIYMVYSGSSLRWQPFWFSSNFRNVVPCCWFRRGACLLHDGCAKWGALQTGQAWKGSEEAFWYNHTGHYWTILDHTGPYYCTYQPLGPHPSVLFFSLSISRTFMEFLWELSVISLCTWGRTYHAIHGIHDIHSFQGQGRRCLRSFSQRWDASWRPTTFVPILASPAVKPSVVHHALRTASWGLGGKKIPGHDQRSLGYL